ncbi:hypothetical protein [Nocardioides sp.]|uniref:hypothetical protein n=1 Tax=Nocardioides sp. TaxID=35761 RepID=UPI001A232ABF|nr:hypothetical protein [Nocardioides sp.]MBJ7357624.1 hypothetical protein [Nocardioides sp.]
MTVLHMGSLHPVEQLLTLVLAFGPFVVLGGVIWWRRRTEEPVDGREDQRQDQAEDAGQPDR